MIEKHLLVADRVRRPPREGFSWVDRRFLRDFASRLSGDAVFLYFLLAAVSDKHGLSFYGDATIAVRLRMREEAVVAARDASGISLYLVELDGEGVERESIRSFDPASQRSQTKCSTSPPTARSTALNAARWPPSARCSARSWSISAPATVCGSTPAS